MRSNGKWARIPRFKAPPYFFLICVAAALDFHETFPPFLLLLRGYVCVSLSLFVGCLPLSLLACLLLNQMQIQAFFFTLFLQIFQVWLFREREKYYSQTLIPLVTSLKTLVCAFSNFCRETIGLPAPLVNNNNNKKKRSINVRKKPTISTSSPFSSCNHRGQCHL